MSDFRAMEIRIFSVGHVLQQIILVLSRCRAPFFLCVAGVCQWHGKWIKISPRNQFRTTVDKFYPCY